MQYFDQIRDIVVESGQLVMHYFQKDIQIFCKPDGSLVTNVDIENEKFLHDKLLEIIPHAGVLGEESGCQSEELEYMWVIDPLDGTKNFIKGIPHFCISIALTFRGQPIVAAIYNPNNKQFYYAEKNFGTWINGIKKFIIQEQDFENKGIIVVVDEVQFQQIKSEQTYYGLFEHLHVSNRYFGSAGLDAAYGAAGHIDFILFEDIAWWDVAAGMLLIEEAGGYVSWEKNLGTKDCKGVFKAGHPLIYQQFLTIIDKQNL